MGTVVDELEMGCQIHLEFLFCDYFSFFFFGEMEETYEWDKSAGGVVF